MPTNLTLKNVPDEVYERLKASAESHRRSLNSEAIVCLESVLLPNRVAPSDRVARARALAGAAVGAARLVAPSFLHRAFARHAPGIAADAG